MRISNNRLPKLRRIRRRRKRELRKIRPSRGSRRLDKLVGGLGNTSEIEKLGGGIHGKGEKKNEGEEGYMESRLNTKILILIRTYTLSLERKERRGTREWDMKERRIFNERFSTQTICCN
jgi:hypothetical protein